MERAMMNVYVHPTALVETTKIGSGTRVWAFTHVTSGATVGSNCNIGGQCFIEAGATIGDNVTVKNGNSIWAGIAIGDGAFIGPQVVFTNDLRPRSPRLAYASDRYSEESWLSHTVIKEGVSIGAGAVILPGVTLKEFCMIAAGAIVTKDVPAHALVMGAPARITGWVCYCGQKLNEDDATAWCKQCSAKFERTDSEIRALSTPAVAQPLAAVIAATPLSSVAL
jgi:UDP-2-acetamido-3-amino-2,3-dideoxy-glucuronate N-acetyltransferase